MSKWISASTRVVCTVKASSAAYHLSTRAREPLLRSTTISLCSHLWTYGAYICRRLEIVFVVCRRSQLYGICLFSEKEWGIEVFQGIQGSSGKSHKEDNLSNKKLNGLDYCNKEFDKYLNSAGIIHQKISMDHNGLNEWFNHTFIKKARCLLFDANLGKEFWGQATNSAVYQQNRFEKNCFCDIEK